MNKSPIMESYIFITTIVFGLLSRPLQADVPTCDTDSPDFTSSPYCLPGDYNKDIIPPMEGPLHIHVNTFIFEVCFLARASFTSRTPGREYLEGKGIWRP